MELLGYASGDDDLYLVYEYIRNGSLSDHLHDPLLKGIQMDVAYSFFFFNRRLEFKKLKVCKKIVAMSNA